MSRYTSEVFNSSGTWLCPAGIKTVMVLGMGGGGAGGSATNNEGACGGIGSGERMIFIQVVPGTSYTITVGAGGVANTSAAYGGHGGDTSFDSIETFPGSHGGWWGGSPSGHLSGQMIPADSDFMVPNNNGGFPTFSDSSNDETSPTSGSINGWGVGAHGTVVYTGNGGGGGGAGGRANGADGGALDTSGDNAPANSGAGGGGCGMTSLAARKLGGAGGSGRLEVVWLN